MNVSKTFMRELLGMCISMYPCLYHGKDDTYGNRDFWYRYYICYSMDGNRTQLLALELWDRNGCRTDYPIIVFYCEYDTEMFGWMEC